MSTVAKKVIMGSGAVAVAYEIEQSILFNSADIPILYRQASATGNRRTFTYSCWVKRAKEDLKIVMSFGNAADTNAAYIQFYNGSLRVIISNSGVQAQLFTNNVFRDFSSWYHIVLAVDTTQGTAANRLKLYVNGTQLTSFSTATYPSQNYDTAFSLDDNYLAVGNNTYYITSNSYNGGIDGYIAEVHVIDGAAKAPSDFGETNSDTGQWVPKEYTGGSYGTNGCYLPFSKSGNGGSAYFAGNDTSYMTLPANSLNLGANNFTIEFWLYTTSTAQQSIVGSTRNQNGYGSYMVNINHSNTKLRFYCRYTGISFSYNVESGTFPTNSWNHVAVTRDGANLRFFLNGTQAGSTNTSLGSDAIDSPENGGSSSGATSIYYVGRTTDTDASYGGSRLPLIGYLSNLRVVIGTAVYTSNFTPSTTPLTNITNTTLLMNGGVSSIVGPALTVVGSVSFSALQPFASSVTSFASDTSGQGNNMTVANLLNSDVVTDSPTNNFCTLNPLDSALPALLEGNTNTGTAGANSWKMARSTFELTTGKWYWEMKWTGNTVNSTNGYQMGLKTPTSTLTAAAAQAGSFAFQGTEIYSTNGSTNTVTISPGSATTGQNDIIMFAYDADAGKMWIGVNGTWTSSGDPAAGSNNQWASIPTTGVSPFAGIYGSNISMDCNFGQKTYAYTPPSGFKSLSTANLPDPAIPLPSANFNTVLYTGNNADDRTITTGMQSDFVWIKTTNATNYHNLFDKVRGAGKVIYSNTADAESTRSDSLTAFLSTGFTIDQNAAYNDLNGSDHTYVAWNWKANGAGSTDTSGDIDATVSANPTAGFSIVKYTATSDADATVPHGLGVAPEMVFYKWGSSAWYCWTTVIDGSNDRLVLDRTDAKSTVSSSYGSFTSSFIRGIDSSAATIAYCFASKPSFSKIGVYTGNGNALGAFVNAGFKPAFVMIKRTDTTANWLMYDNKRPEYNPPYYLLANGTFGGNGTDVPINILSNGFKITSSSAASNANNGTYLYIAFAESPFKTANAR